MTKPGTKTSVDVHIYADDVSEDRLREIETVRDLYFPEAFLFRARPHMKAPSGCWNILNAIKTSSKFADNVYLVEEDVLVYPYFFEWHERHGDAPVSCGRKLPRYELYTNPGTCFRRPLLDALMPHICDEYFQDTDGYCRANFAEQFISTLDDGLIRRVLKQNGLYWVFPQTPVCAHQGMRGYDRLDIYKNYGVTLGERIIEARKILSDPINRETYARDWEPYSPNSLPPA